MKILSFLTVFVFFTGCSSIKDCAVSPRVEVKIEKQDNKESTEQKEKSTLETVKEVVEPGAQLTCRY